MQGNMSVVRVRLNNIEYSSFFPDYNVSNVEVLYGFWLTVLQSLRLLCPILIFITLDLWRMNSK